jgi:hypothetical protein
MQCRDSSDSEWAPVMEFADFPWVPVIDGDFLIEVLFIHMPYAS